MPTKDEENELAGVWLFLVNAEERASESKKDTLHITMKMHASVTDVEVWKDVEAKLRDGVKIYTENDFKGLLLDALLDALREDHIALEKKVVLLERENKRLQDENRRMAAGLSVLNQQLEG